uniref:Myb-like domain-containing protein n=1 Tax=Labrus bergylta TaxID=56723 RepID=A0A3Q3E6A7_9LABR
MQEGRGRRAGRRGGTGGGGGTEEGGEGEKEEDGEKDKDEDQDQQGEEEEEEDEDFDDLTQDEDEEEVMSSASEESVLSVPELQETMKQLTWLAAERRLCADGDSEEDHSVQTETQRRITLPPPPREGEQRRYKARGRRSRPLRGLRRSRQERHSVDTTKLLLLYDENILDNDPHRESKDVAFAQSYLNRVREALQDLPGQAGEFVSLLSEFEQAGEGQELIMLFRKLRCILGDRTDLLRDFAAFLHPEQALQCGLFEEQQAFERSRRFLRQVEISFGDNPSHYQKIIKALQTGPDLSPISLKSQMATLLKGHNHLQNEFWVFFDNLRPPPAHLGQFEEAHWPEEEGTEVIGHESGGGASSGFEEVTLPELEEEEEGQKIAPLTSRHKDWSCLCPHSKIRSKSSEKEQSPTVKRSKREEMLQTPTASIIITSSISPTTSSTPHPSTTTSSTTTSSSTPHPSITSSTTTSSSTPHPSITSSTTTSSSTPHPLSPPPPPPPLFHSSTTPILYHLLHHHLLLHPHPSITSSSTPTPLSPPPPPPSLYHLLHHHLLLHPPFLYHLLHHHLLLHPPFLYHLLLHPPFLYHFLHHHLLLHPPFSITSSSTPIPLSLPPPPPPPPPFLYHLLLHLPSLYHLLHLSYLLHHHLFKPHPSTTTSSNPHPSITSSTTTSSNPHPSTTTSSNPHPSMTTSSISPTSSNPPPSTTSSNPHPSITSSTSSNPYPSFTSTSPVSSHFSSSVYPFTSLSSSSTSSICPSSDLSSPPSAPPRPSPPPDLPVCAKNISLTASGEKVILWTREADRVILTTCQKDGANQNTFQAISILLGNKTPSEVSRRFQDLMRLFRTAARHSNSEDVTPPTEPATANEGED